jgi:nuclear transport factor 2 (NTF2) superfamily protein
MAEPTTAINMVEIALRSKKNVGRVLASVVTSIVINNFLASWIYAARDDDEDETFLEKYAQAFTSGLVDDLNPITYYPFVKDIWSLFQGYDVERGDMSVIADVSDALKKTLQIIGKDTSEMNEEQLAKHHEQTWDAILTLADGVASVCGIPAKNVRREVSAGINTVKTLTNGLGFSGTSLANAICDSALDALPVVNYLWMPDKADRLYTAIKNGDTDYVNRLKQEYGDDTKVSKAIQKGLKENDPRIYEAALKDIAGLPAERLKLQKEVMADGFAWEDVRNATVSIINKLTPDAAKAAPKEHGYYETDDFVTFVSKGQTSYANEAKKDIITTYQLNGKTEDEAVKAFGSSVKTGIKELFLSGGISVATAEHALVTYLDMSKSDANTQVSKWNYEKTTGSEYSDKREEFLAGTLSAKDLITALKTVEGKTDKEAASMLISYTRDAYDEGRFSKNKAREIMMTYGNLTAEQTDSKLRYIDIKKQFPDTYVDDNWVDEYYDEVESSGISLNVFVEYRNKVKGITGEGKKQQRMAVINSLPITKAQKDSLYFAEGWAKSTLHEAPWR